MALNFKQTSKKPNPKLRSRNSKRYQKLEGRHIPERILFGHTYTGDWYNFPRVNMVSWLAKQVDRPMDMVFSDFVKEYKRTYKGTMGPEDFLYNYIDRKKKQYRHCYGPKYYISDSGFLCRYSKYTLNSSKPKECSSHVDYNKKVLKGFRMGDDDAGPRYVGKLWIRVKGITKVLDTWLVRESKLNGRGGFLETRNISKAEKYNLSLYMVADVEGIGSSYHINQHPYGLMIYCDPFIYKFIIKLSDLQ